MSEENKKCPLARSLYPQRIDIYSEQFEQVAIFEDCLREKCAWWIPGSKDVETCSIKMIAEQLLRRG